MTSYRLCPAKTPTPIATRKENEYQRAPPQAYVLSSKRSADHQYVHVGPMKERLKPTVHEERRSKSEDVCNPKNDRQC